MKSLLILFLLATCLYAEKPQWHVIETKPWLHNGKKVGTHYKIKNVSEAVIDVGHGVNGKAISNWFLIGGIGSLYCYEIPSKFIGI